MALSGLEIYKLLPKTNCKKCGFQTCLAFAMQLAKKAVALDKCPFVGSDVRGVLEEASLPAIRLVEIGSGEQKVCVGNETVMYRHEEKFHHPTALGFILEDDLGDLGLAKAVEEISKLNFERVGQMLKVDLIALKQKGSKKDFLSALTKVRKMSRMALVLMPNDNDVEALKEALELCAQDKVLIHCSNKGQLLAFVAVCKGRNVALSFSASDVSEFSEMTKKLSADGIADIVLNVAASSVQNRIWQLTQIRRLAIKKAQRSLGFPTMTIVDTADPYQASCQAAAYIAKYSSIVLMKTRKLEYVLPLLTLRQNIFTDPQKPLQVEPNVYPVGAAGENSPVLITTNFSLTYYTVLGEIEASRVPSHLICVDTEGMSVLTAWAAEKFNAEKVADTLVRFKLDKIVKHKSLIIPGYVSMMSGDLEDKSGWKILVGPREAAGISSYLKNLGSE